jgi:hypothetical protein
MDGLEGDAPTEFGAEDAFIAGVPLRYTPAYVLTSLRDFMCPHHGFAYAELKLFIGSPGKRGVVQFV